MYERAPLSRELADLIARSIAQCVAHAEAFTVTTETYRPAGIFAGDLHAIRELDGEHKRVRDGLHATIISTVRMLLAHTLDHIRSLHADLQREPAPIWSPSTLSRAVLESTVLMCHLLEPTVTTEQRLCREAAFWLDDTQYAATAAATFGDVHAESVRDYHRFKLDELEAGGFTVEVDGKQRPVRVRFGEEYAELRLNITDQAAHILPPGAPSPYRLGSGAAHSRPWFPERSATARPNGGFIGESTTAMTAALTVMYCMSSWVTCWGGYFGLDVTQQLAGIRHTMETLLQEGMHTI